MTPWRVLIADNEALMRVELSAMLAEDGFDVVGCAVDSAQALALAAELRPDLVIMDAVTRLARHRRDGRGRAVRACLTRRHACPHGVARSLERDDNPLGQREIGSKPARRHPNATCLPHGLAG